MPSLAELLLALLGPDPLTRQERRLIRERKYLEIDIPPMADSDG